MARRFSVGSVGALVYMELPPEEVAAVSVLLRAEGSKHDSDLTTTNADYWQALQTSTTGYALEHTFIVDRNIFLPLVSSALS